jgi:hypothetical protein
VDRPPRRGGRSTYAAGVQEELVGKLGDVVVRIEGAEGPGEVSLLVEGMWERYFAHAPNEILIGRRVLVVHDRGDRNVDVEPWDVAT